MTPILQKIYTLAQSIPTPFWAYDSQKITEQVQVLQNFDHIRYAQKANSNIHILKHMHDLGVKVDAVSLGEIERALAAGFDVNSDPFAIVFTADVFDSATLTRIVDTKIPVNTGSTDMLEQLGMHSPNHPVWLRINPGFGHGHSQKTNTGGEQSKHGIWHSDIPKALEIIQRYQLNLVGIHMHIGSGVDYTHLAQVGEAMYALFERYNLDVQWISAGGGLSIPYQENDPVVDTEHYFKLWDDIRQKIAKKLNHPVGLEIEPGRFLVAQAGYLVSQVRATKMMGNNFFALIDAGFNDLMRPSLYGSYHHVSILHDEQTQHSNESPLTKTILAGPLCESGDVFTQHEGGIVTHRMLGPIFVDDFIAFHDAGAYGASMSSNYNSRPLIAEYLLQDGQWYQIRQAQKIQELLALETKQAI